MGLEDLELLYRVYTQPTRFYTFASLPCWSNEHCIYYFNLSCSFHFTYIQGAVTGNGRNGWRDRRTEWDREGRSGGIEGRSGTGRGGVEG